jgi:hypothetical protein
MYESSTYTQNDLLCRLKLSLDTIFHEQKQPLEKIGEMVKLWNTSLPPGSCGSGVSSLPDGQDSDENPLAEMYVYTNESEYFANVVSETREDKVRTDIFYTVTTPLYGVKAYNDIFNSDNELAGQSVVDTWGSELLWDKTKKTWPAKFTAVLKRDILKKVIGYYDDESDSWIAPDTDSPTGAAPTGAATDDPGAAQVATKPAGDDTNDLLEDYLILGTFDSINLFDYIKNNYVSVLTPQIKKGSDNLYYLLQAIPKDNRDLNKVSYKLSVFRTRDMAEKARNGMDKSTKKK